MVYCNKFFVNYYQIIFQLIIVENNFGVTMKKQFLFLIVLIFIFNTTSWAGSPRFENPNKFAYEFLVGIRAPIGTARNDISTGFTFKLGIGYQLTKNLEIFHAAIDFGTSTPHDPQWVTIYDPYNYYPRLEQETVYVYGIPLTMRYRFQIHEQLEIYVGGGVDYYWFQTRLADPYWGELKKSRKRHGPGVIFEAGIFTDAFGEKILAGITTNVLYLNTNGKTLTTPKLEDDPDKRISRDDIYFTIAISLRYYMRK